MSRAAEVSLDYVIHRDGFVTLDGEPIGQLVTGDDGLAYVDPLHGYLFPPGQHRFHSPPPDEDRSSPDPLTVT